MSIVECKKCKYAEESNLPYDNYFCTRFNVVCAGNVGCEVGHPRSCSKEEEYKAEIARLQKEADEFKKDLEARGIFLEDYFSKIKIGEFVSDEWDNCFHSSCSSKNKITNGDKLRSMTDEQLAEFHAPNDSGCPPSATYEDERGAKHCCHRDSGCEKCWLDWLKQEAE